MSPLEKADNDLEAAISEIAMRIVVPRMSDFDDLWEIANRVCDRYNLQTKAA